MRLLSAGARAGTRKEPMLLRTPMARAPRETKIRKGKSHRVILTARSALTGSNPGAIIFTRRGERAAPPAAAAMPATRSTAKACRASPSAGSLPLAESTREKTGTKEADKAPSARSCRARLARVKATLKASSRPDAPNHAAVMISRARPSTLLARVPAIMKRACLTIVDVPFATGGNLLSFPLSRNIEEREMG